MLFECPQCGKVIDMTLEELALSKKVVVCPQCLNEFLAQGVDIPASMLRTNVATTRASRQLYCHSCGESLPIAGLKFCPYCGASQNLAAPAASTADKPVAATAEASTQALGDKALKTNEDRAVVEDDAYDMMSRLPLIRPLPRLRSKREVMGSPLTRAICYILIFILIGIFLFILYLSNFDEDGSVARSIGLNIGG
jgi:predicted Zn finger-like uncharacterized protein